MESLGYKTSDKLLQASGRVDKETKNLQNGKTSTYVKKCNPTSPIGFRNWHHEESWDIISYHLHKKDIQSLKTFKQGSTKVKSIFIKVIK